MRRTAGNESSPDERPESPHARVSPTQGQVSQTQRDFSQTHVSPVRARLHMCIAVHARTHARAAGVPQWVQGMSAVESGLPRTDAPVQVVFERVARPVQDTPPQSPHGSPLPPHRKVKCVETHVLPVIAVTEPPPVPRSFSFDGWAEALRIVPPVSDLPAGQSRLPCAPHLPLPFGLVSPPLLAAPDLLLRGPAGLRSDGISSLRVCLRPAHIRLSWAEET